MNGETDQFERVCAEIRRGGRIVSLAGLTSTAAKAFVLTRIRAALGKTLVVVTDTNGELETIESDLAYLLEKQARNDNPAPADAQSQIANRNSQIVSLPSFETDIYSNISPHAETLERRALALWRLAQSTPDFVIVSAKSLATRTTSPGEIRKLGAVLARDEDFAPEELVERLAACGYVREEPIKNVGEFSVRGGIVDVWSPAAEMPVRVEFFGDTVDSIREFDPDTQLSTAQLTRIELVPMREFSASPSDFRDWAFFAREKFDDDKDARAVRDRTEFADHGESFPGWEFLLPLTAPRGSTVFDYLKDAVFVIDEPGLVEQTLSGFFDGLMNRYNEIRSAGELALDPSELFLSGPELREGLSGVTRLELRALGKAAAGTGEEISDFGTVDPDSNDGESGEPAQKSQIANRKSQIPMFLFPTIEIDSEFEIGSRATRKFHGDIAAFVRESKEKLEDYSFVFESLGLVERFTEILRDYDVQVPARNLNIGELSSGFEIPSLGITVFTEIDVFGENLQREAAKPNPKTQIASRKALGAFISDFRDLKQGDYVVHVDHGIGRFEALQTIAAQGSEREFMLLVYADNTKLFVPVERLDLVSRYSSGEATQPSLDRLGGLGWQKTKAKAKRAMRDMADELLRLYAERKMVQGFAFSADAPWQKEFEDAFPYQLTVDQANAIEDTKGDMETAVPMDRLVIGDVGYGKTEVAMRAAFKAVMDGRQVAVLTPTTVLAYQHFETFKKRFAAFPVSIDLLSRFRSAKEQKAVVEAAENSKVDILIGTHRVLSNDVKLPNLGLVVVDEEQRFGVAHKEKLKHLKKKVDVLTLSATPIPRTLNMSLLGMRDMSVIETPPRDRLAINTQVVQFSEGVIKSAIELEMARNGQVFFIHNRVETIETIAAHVKKIVPNARIVIAHGQMNEKEMEQAVLDFVDFKFDVLVATTIIENGIDIPRANTIIINRADNYGLSQLYQLRGRVGRSNRRAYAYLLISAEIELTPIARRRLSAIREFSDLGAGFRIAALDLELRGAGNILGGQQSGQLDALGFDLYTKMLERTIAELKGEEIVDEISVSINLGIDVAIPQDYISETSQRLRTYKRISSAESEERLTAIHAEIEDRYGRIPESVNNLFDYARLRKLAESMNIVSVDKTREGFAVKLSEHARVAPEKLMELLAGNDSASFTPNGVLRIAGDAENPIGAARRVLEQIKA
ncbi:MAG: transcription-repair coupling factor [Acidobacteria bacterium]|nr:transcription-repair coupling factor [Acidobacteriota bacterium]